jgi:hypothetical protein
VKGELSRFADQGCKGINAKIGVATNFFATIGTFEQKGVGGPACAQTQEGIDGRECVRWYFDTDRYQRKPTLRQTPDFLEGWIDIHNVSRL